MGYDESDEVDYLYRRWDNLERFDRFSSLLGTAAFCTGLYFFGRGENLGLAGSAGFASFLFASSIYFSRREVKNNSRKINDLENPLSRLEINVEEISPLVSSPKTD